MKILTQISNIAKVILPQKLVMMAARLGINVMNVLREQKFVQDIGPMLFIVENLILCTFVIYIKNNIAIVHQSYLISSTKKRQFSQLPFFLRAKWWIFVSYYIPEL